MMKVRTMIVTMALVGLGFAGGRAEAQLQRGLVPVEPAPEPPEDLRRPEGLILVCGDTALVGFGEGYNGIEAENAANADVNSRCAQSVQNAASGCCTIHSCGFLEEGSDGDYVVWSCWGNPYIWTNP